MKRILKISYFVLPLAFVGLAFNEVYEDNKQFEISKNIELFANVYRELNAFYVDDIDPGSLMRKGMESMVASLDPFTNYIAESDIEGYRLISEGRYFGIGAQSKKMGDYLTITELYEGQPADQAGLRVGDRILSIDGRTAKGKSKAEVEAILQGFPGTQVNMAVERPGVEAPVQITLTRGEVDVANVPYSGLIGSDADIAYVNLSTFTQRAGRNVANALRDMRLENPDLKGMVLDLRGNGGGLLSEAVNLCNIFIPQNEIVVTTKGKVRDWDRTFRTRTNAIDEEIPLVVLINDRSASASEIVSGVMQDYDRGVLIGQRSYGKGLVQNTKDIGYNAKIKLTTAKYYIPSGRCIQSVEYEDGEPVDIADDKRAVFQTRSGREVLDGGGVAPDIKTERGDNIPVIKSLISNDLIFDFVTEYATNTTIPDTVIDLKFNDFDAFISFLADKDLRYDTKAEKLMDQLKEKANEEGYQVTDQLVQLERRLKEEQMEVIRANEKVITDLIEKEIAGRYFFQEGKVRIGLRNDEEVQEAIRLLRDPQQYSAILEGK